MATENEMLFEGATYRIERGDTEQLTSDVEHQAQLPLAVTGSDALDAVLCVLDQRLSAGDAAKVLDSLPGAARARCQRHRAERSERFGLEGFLDRVSAHLQLSGEEAEIVTRAVFAVLPRWLSRKNMAAVARGLPPDLRIVWSDPLSVW
jgi:uncharacterized protein (DUF2267 family)